MLTPNPRACLRKPQHQGHKVKRIILAVCVLCAMAAGLGTIACWSQQKASRSQARRVFPTETEGITKLVEELSNTCEGLDESEQPYYHAKIQLYRYKSFLWSPLLTLSIIIAGAFLLATFPPMLLQAAAPRDSAT